MTLLVNPSAGAGRGARRADAAWKALERVTSVEVQTTTSADDLAARAGHAAANGDAVLAVLGGDGSLSLAARELLQTGGRTALAIFAAGTGNDLARSLRAPVHDYAAMAALIDRGSIRHIDVGTADGVSFVNAAGFGFDAEVIARTTARATADATWTSMSMSMSRASPVRGSRWGYARAALGALFRYRGFSARVDTIGADHAIDSQHRSHLMLVFANGRHFGGAFLIAPTADVADGAVDMISIGTASPARRVLLFARAVRGTHEGCAEVCTARAAEFELRFDAPPQFEADGELHQARSNHVSVRCLPGALAVVAP